MAKYTTYSDKFKQQIVALYKNGKNITTIVEEYQIKRSTIYSWIKMDNISGSFKVKDNLSPEQRELCELRKQSKQLLMENDLLKQVTLIIDRK